ncbi:hypothetical protein CC80DRAFT_521753 [Byssothecium circinans]|uniref:WDR59/RTC1-like RING zinc finger domain-containing protein n=1 Tax=Byssothecium circinans TaxID=147558 RepID=A0A6A5UCV0_9PLEO|nr:hypothetical protein CC80DRAFT_521753 [Byssothecium circinans]
MADAVLPATPFQSPTFDKDVQIAVNEEYTAASISPSGRDVVLAGTQGILIIDLDNPYSPPRYIRYRIGFEVADVQWSPFASRAEWIASTNNNKAIIFNLNIKTNLNEAPIQFTLDSHQGSITDINFSAHHPDVLATCALDTYVFTWDLRAPASATSSLNSVQRTPSVSFADWEGGATQVKWNRQNENILASSHDRYVQIWDIRHGARPISTIHAHFNRVYGIDWHRSVATKILTCSLDKTIKQWDQAGVTEHISKPSRTIVTEYPLLRARHTPFPNGIIALPQHGSAALGLYKQTTVGTQTKCPNAPAHVFGDTGPTRLYEFLWRSRGDCDDGRDNREYQLVTWATDHQLRLHSIDPAILKQAVNFEKGGPLLEKPTKSRMGAQYITFRNGPLPITESKRPSRSQDGLLPTGALSSLFRNSQLGSATSLLNNGQPKRATMTARTVRRDPTRRVVSHVTWMHNVNIEARKIDGKGRAVEQEDDPRHAIAQEITAVIKQYPNLDAEKIEDPYREVVIAFKGPWGDIDNATNPNQAEARKPVFLRLTIGFPDNYTRVEEPADELGDPGIHPLEIRFEKTTAAITASMLEHLKESLQRIANVYAYQGRPALAAIFTYALGESSLEDIIAQAKNPNGLNVEPGPTHGPAAGLPAQEDSSEEEEGSDSGDYENELMNSSLTKTNIPVPVQTVAKFSSPGFLITARLPGHGLAFPNGSASLMMGATRLPRNLRQNPQKDDIFETFGRITAGHGSESPTSSTISWESSSSSPSSSSGSDSEEVRFRNFFPPLPWQKVSSRLNTKASVPSSIDPPYSNKRSVITILDSSVADFIPSKRSLAEEYLIFGDGPTVCSHNAEVAKKHGYEDLADIWVFCRLILNNEVPLDILPQRHRRERVLVLARRALVRIKRKDSGLDLQFDEAEAVKNPKLRGRVKWGHHSVVTYLIPALFNHFEKLADTQMLAMLSCIFSEPAAREGVPSAMAKMRQSHLPMSMEAPAFSLDYFPSDEAAWSLFKPNISVPTTPAHSRYATPVNEFGWHRLSRNLDTYGSHGSSNGPWGSDTIPSEPATPYSTGNTPPNVSRATTFKSATATNTPYGTSPEQSQTTLGKKMAPTGFSNALATFGKNLMSSSPPVKSRTEDLSTSAPASGVTWGTTTFYSSGSQERNTGPPPRSKYAKRPSFGQTDRVNVDHNSDSDSEYEALLADGSTEHTAPLNIKVGDAGEPSPIKVTLKNQDKFDDEACVSAPLLDMSKEWLYRAWRQQYAEMLGCWSLVSKRAEILKFNGLVSYFPSPDEESRGRSKAESELPALKNEKADSIPTLQPPSRTSTLAPPPSRRPSDQLRRLPLSSPRNFYFNPEASEFTPNITTSFTPTTEIPTPIQTGSYYNHNNTITNTSSAAAGKSLRLMIPTPYAETTTESFTSTPLSRSKPYQVITPRLSRPSISRGASNLSSHSHAPSTTTPPKTAKTEGEPIYTCSICWIRVSGRVYWCPNCNHVAHFECMPYDPSSNLAEDTDCVVGCGCGCGFDDVDERARIDLFMEGVRGWDERGGWLPEVEFDEEASTKAELGVGSRIGRRGGVEQDGDRDSASLSAGTVTGRSEGRKKKKKEKERKARLTGKSYF